MAFALVLVLIVLLRKASKNDAFQIIGRVALRKESKLADKAEALVLKSLASP